MNNKVKFLRGTSGEYAVAEKDSDTIYFTTDDGKLYIGDKEVSGDGSITVDDTLSDTSTNPVQNKVVKQAIDNKADKSLYGNTTINVGRKAGTDVGEYSTAEGYDTTASGGYSHAEGEYSTASGYASHAEGSNSNLKGILPDRTVIISDVDYTITGSTAYGMNSHAEGTQSFAYGYSSHAEGYNTTASGSDSHAEGYNATASGHNSHAEGVTTTASGSNSHAEGTSTTASGTGSHAEGNNTTASGSYSHAGGIGTKALHSSEVAYGKYNESNSDTLFSIGDGTNDDARHNAFEITTTGGKLHDKNIATTDDIPDLTPYAKTADVPNIKVNAAVNADTVGGKLPDKIFYENGMSSDLDSATESGCYAASPDALNVPYSMWWLVDTMNHNGQFIVQKAHAIGDTSTTVSYIRNYANNAWSGWTEMYTSGNKPYVTGSATVAADSQICVTNHGFIPTAVIWWDNGISSFSLSFDDKQFAIDAISNVDKTIYYLILK